MDNELEERSSLESILEYVQLLWHWAWLLILAALVAGVAAYYITDRQPRVYQSSTTVIVNAGSNSIYDSYSAVYYSQSLADIYAQTMNTNVNIEEVSKKLGYPINASIDVEKVEAQSLINITVTDSDPEKAAVIANTLVLVFSDNVLAEQAQKYSGLKAGIEGEIAVIDKELDTIIERLAALEIKFAEIDAAQRKAAELEAKGIIPPPTPEKDPADIAEQTKLKFSQSQYQNTRASLFANLQQINLSEVQSTNTIKQLNPALANPVPVQPQPTRSAMLAAVVGLMIAAGVIFLVAFLEDSISDPDEIRRKWGVPVIGLITNYNSGPNVIITMSQPRAPVSEAFRSLRTSLQFSGVDSPLHTLLITSASPSDGKTSIVANLATVIAQNERDVVVVDSDLRRPRIHKIFKLSNRIGLSDYFIRSQDRLNGVVKKTDTKGLCVITSGSLPPNPSELLSSTRMVEVMKLLEKHFDLVIMDTPPLLAVTDALVLAPRVDGVILVMDPKKTKRAAARHAIEQLQRVNANLLGVVLNNVKVKRSQYYYNRNYYYGKQHAKGSDEPVETLEISTKAEDDKKESPQPDSVKE